MLKKYVIRNFYDDIVIGGMLFDREVNKRTIHIHDMEHSCIYLQIKYPSGQLNEEETDSLIKYRVDPPERQLTSYYMNAATGKTGSTYNPLHTILLAPGTSCVGLFGIYRRGRP